MGVAGSGKTTIWKLLAEGLGWKFIEGDEYHSAENIAWMNAGIALTDQERIPWLQRVHQALLLEKDAVVACSALKKNYRERLAVPGAKFIYLKTDGKTLLQRLQTRAHFFPPKLLQSQLDTLEEPEDALVVDGALPVNSVIRIIQDYL